MRRAINELKTLNADHVYIAGPMRGIRDFNFPAFHAVAAELSRCGFTVFNPAAEDEKMHGLGFNKSETGDFKDLAGSNFNFRQTLELDLVWIARHAKALVMLLRSHPRLAARGAGSAVWQRREKIFR